MALPLLKYAPTTQNSRVDPLRVGSDEDPKAVSMDKAMDREDQNFVIEAAYRQIFFHAFKVDRDLTLESQLRNGQITVRDFIRSLCLSDTFNRSFYNLNSNYNEITVYYNNRNTSNKITDSYSNNKLYANNIVVNINNNNNNNISN